MRYTIIIPKPVQKQLKNLPAETYQRIIEKIEQLSSQPCSLDTKKLKGLENEYHIRIGDYRVRYEINDKALTVLLLSCRHRRDAYRD
jgi:mRNA interferase RelE/StbE